nr:GDSL-type esterase/lipase family protein [uncultured Actinoplanes sp.]
MRRWQVAVLAVLSVLALACEGTGQAEPAPTGTPVKGLPSSMAALGDSITAGFGSCFTLVACRRRSWSTGGDAVVDSHYRRILKGNPKIKGHADNFAEPGARAADLAGQARAAVAAKAQYVTVLIGGNDACSRVTPVSTFRDQVDAALRTLKKGLPASRVLVVSIPDLYRLWQVGHEHPDAVRVWNRGVCPALLANPTSTAPADRLRRREAAERIDAYNRELAAACEAYGKKCRWDGGKVHAVRFSLDLVNRLDYFHPSSEGQATLAEVSYPGRFNW